MKKTLVLGAVNDPAKYAYRAARSLLSEGHQIELVGKSEGEIQGNKIHTDQPHLDNIGTVTLYVGTRNLPPLFDYILSLNPDRIIFNPGTYHPELERLASEKNIETVNGCTLVMLATRQY